VNDSDRRRSPDGFDDDAIFADIIAHLKDEESEQEQPVWPAGPTADDAPTYRLTIPQPPAEAGDPPAPDATDSTTAPQQGKPEDESQGELQGESLGESLGELQGESLGESLGESQGESQAVPAPQGWRAHEVHDDEEEHFEPRAVTPLPVGDLQFWAILVGMIGGPLLLVYLVFFNRSLSSYWTLTAIAMSVGGFALLVSRLPGNEGDDDDGARL